MSEILNLVVDGKLTSKQEARAIVEEQAENLAAIEETTVDEARAEFRRDIELATHLYSPVHRENIRELFELEAK